MQTRSSQIAPQQEYYADSLLTQPTASQSVFDNLAMGFATPIVALNMLDSQFAKKPEGRAILSTFNATRLENATPGMGWGQWMANEGANLLGFGLNPVSWGLGGAGGAVAETIPSVASRLLPDAASVFMRQPLKTLLGQPLGKYVPEMIGKEGAEKPLSLALLSDKTLTTFGSFAGAGVPQGIVDNFNQDTNHIEWGGVAREAGEMGAFGIAIGSVPFAWGVLRGKINRASGRGAAELVDRGMVDKALEAGHITPEEHAWYLDYMEHQADPKKTESMPDLQRRASEIANKNGHTANTVSNEALFEILRPDDVTNLHGVIADQLAGDVPEPYRRSLSDFIIHNRMDYIRQKPEWLDGVRGYVDFVNGKLESKASKLAEADSILDKHLLKGAKDNMPFSQKELFKMMKKSGFESSHLKNIPITVPENMGKHLKSIEKISKLKTKLRIEKKKFEHKTYYRGEAPGYPGQKVQYQMLNYDDEFGKGYWFAESKEHAEVYGHEVEELKGNYKLYDVVTGKDAELKSIYLSIKDALHNENYLKAKIFVNKLRDKAKEKGYEGLIRREGWADKFGLRTRVNGIAKAKKEIMFFERPKPTTQEYVPNKQTLRRIEELEASLPKILTPKEELNQLRQTLLSKGLKQGFERSNAYHRLLDLSNVWQNARTLLDRVHLEHEYNKQTAFRDLAHQTLRIADSDMPRIAKPENVMDYLKRRIEGQLRKVEPIADVESAVKTQQDVPADYDTILKEQGEQIKNTSAEEAKEEFVKSTEKLAEFKSNENIFKNLISCVMGSLNG